MDPNITITARVYVSPRADAAYPWKWVVENVETRETLEFGAEETEEDARREASAARASWICILAGHDSQAPR